MAEEQNGGDKSTSLLQTIQTIITGLATAACITFFTMGLNQSYEVRDQRKDIEHLQAELLRQQKQIDEFVAIRSDLRAVLVQLQAALQPTERK